MWVRAGLHAQLRAPGETAAGRFPSGESLPLSPSPQIGKWGGRGREWSRDPKQKRLGQWVEVWGRAKLQAQYSVCSYLPFPRSNREPRGEGSRDRGVS